MLDDDDDTGADFAPGAAKGMKNLFALSSAESQKGNATFQWQPPRKDKTPRQPKGGGGGEPAAEGERVFLANALCMLFAGQENRGRAMCVLSAKVAGAQQAPQTQLTFTDQQKRVLLDIPLGPQTYWVQNPYEGQQQYATVQDQSGYSWTVQFRNAEDCTQFSLNVLLVQYSLSAFGDTPRSSFDLQGGTGDSLDDGDGAQVQLRTWLAEPHEKCPQLLKLGLLLDEEPAKKVKLGSGKAMVGLEQALVGTSKAQRKFVVCPPGQTAGAGHPSVGARDTVCVWFEVVQTKKKKADDPAPPPPPPPSDPPPPAVAPAPAATQFQQFQQQQQQQQQEQVLAVTAGPSAPEPAAAAPAAAAPAAPAAAAGLAGLLGGAGGLGALGGGDAGGLLGVLLASQLQQQQRGGGEPGRGALMDLERQMDRVMIQIQQLYQKMDQMDVSRKLEENNEKIEAMFRRVTGRGPSAGYTPGKAGIAADADVQTLLAEIERREKRIEELTDSYHNALASISSSKDEMHGLQSDLQIERDTAIKRLEEANERHRLQLLDFDVRARSEKEEAVDRAFREGKAQGNKEGFEEGKREAFLEQVGGDPSELQQQVSQAREEAVQLQSQLLEAQRRLQDERRQHDEQMQLTQQLLSRYEDRERSGGGGGGGGGIGQEEALAMLTKSLKKIMNGVFYAVEDQLNEDGGESFTPTAVKAMLTKVIKVKTKEAIASMREEVEGMQRAASPSAAVPPPMPPMPHTMPSMVGAAAGGPPPPPPPPPADLPQMPSGDGA